MWIQNVSMHAVAKGHHIQPGPNAMLIQIVDPDMNHPQPAYPFAEVHRFKFLDVEEDSEQSISTEQARQLVNCLQHAHDKRMNVIVHCVAGVCRSGAVAEVGVMLGFDDAEAFRAPNLLVKHKMMGVLGWLYTNE